MINDYLEWDAPIADDNLLLAIQAVAALHRELVIDGVALLKEISEPFWTSSSGSCRTYLEELRTRAGGVERNFFANLNPEAQWMHLDYPFYGLSKILGYVR